MSPQSKNSSIWLIDTACPVSPEYDLKEEQGHGAKPLSPTTLRAFSQNLKMIKTDSEYFILLNHCSIIQL